MSRTGVYIEIGENLRLTLALVIQAAVQQRVDVGEVLCDIGFNLKDVVELAVSYEHEETGGTITDGIDDKKPKRPPTKKKWVDYAKEKQNN